MMLGLIAMVVGPIVVVKAITTGSVVTGIVGIGMYLYGRDEWRRN